MNYTGAHYCAWSLLMLRQLDGMLPPEQDQGERYAYTPLLGFRDYLIETRWASARALLEACHRKAFDEPRLADLVDGDHVLIELIAMADKIEMIEESSLPTERVARLRIERTVKRGGSFVLRDTRSIWWMATVAVVAAVLVALGGYTSVGHFIFGDGHPALLRGLRRWLPVATVIFLLAFGWLCSKFAQAGRG